MQVRDHIGAILRILQAGEGHLGAWNRGLRIGEVNVQFLGRPGNAAVLVRVGVVEVGDRRRAKAERFALLLGAAAAFREK